MIHLDKHVSANNLSQHSIALPYVNCTFLAEKDRSREASLTVIVRRAFAAKDHFRISISNVERIELDD